MGGESVRNTLQVNKGGKIIHNFDEDDVLS